MMPMMFDPESLSGEQRAQFEAQQRAGQAFMDKLNELEQAQRQSVLDWPMLWCTCRENWRELGLGGQPIQQGCFVHGQFLISPDGKVIM